MSKSRTVQANKLVSYQQLKTGKRYLCVQLNMKFRILEMYYFKDKDSFNMGTKVLTDNANLATDFVLAIEHNNHKMCDNERYYDVLDMFQYYYEEIK